MLIKDMCNEKYIKPFNNKKLYSKVLAETNGFSSTHFSTGRMAISTIRCFLYIYFILQRFSFKKMLLYVVNRATILKCLL